MSARDLDRAPSGVAAGTWTLDLDASTARFSVRNFGLHRVHGTVPLVAGFLDIDDTGEVVAASGEADPARVDTGNARRDADLRAPGLFSVVDHPRWTFRAEQTRGSGLDRQVHGTLNVRSACPVVWAAHVADTDDGTIRVTASARIDRRDAGVKAPRVLVGREIDIMLNLMFRPPPAP